MRLIPSSLAQAPLIARRIRAAEEARRQRGILAGIRRTEEIIDWVNGFLHDLPTTASRSEYFGLDAENFEKLYLQAEEFGAAFFNMKQRFLYTTPTRALSLEEITLWTTLNNTLRAMGDLMCHYQPSNKCASPRRPS